MKSSYVCGHFPASAYSKTIVHVAVTNKSFCISKSVLQLGFEGRGVPSRALFAWSYKNESTMCHVMCLVSKKVREKSRECHNHKPQPFPDPKRKRKLTNLNKHKPNKRTKSTKISSLFPKRGNRNTKRTEKHKNKMTHGNTYNKSQRRINYKATKSKTNTDWDHRLRTVGRANHRGGLKHFYS